MGKNLTVRLDEQLAADTEAADRILVCDARETATR
jgi:hypothetical protein